MLKKSKGNRFHQQGFIFSTFPINFIICLTPYKRASTTGAFFIFKRKENIMGVRVVFPDMGKDPSIQLIEKTITQNGTYDAITDGANGYSKVNVNVEGGGGSSDFSKAILVNSEELEPNIAYRADKTVAEIFQAMNDGKMVFVDMGNKTCIVTNCNTVLKRIAASVVTFNTTSMETTCAVSANISATAQFSSTDDYPVFMQQSV